MHPQSQLFLPTGGGCGISESNFHFYTQGNLMYQEDSRGTLMDDIEEKIRFQLEQADRMQGFQIMADTNSGYGSLA